ncbi:head-tail connector protein [Oryzicola mucosus]|uniref:Phage gp6-like head-tail connector protein n=1 Tax=Oryzicola mucosus TaxID=2767425 RepID=A0A8J6Q4Z9_9HYPH|nr:phage gp6-like head-tail connector protein [Oryzicola mucosus]MBD0416510.1 phage gp6-like head-tail connector protein [Oryzicola mucosus]
MKIVQSGEPVGEVVSLELLRKQVRNADDAGVYTEDDDGLLQQYLDAAVEWVQDVCGQVLLRTAFKATGTDFALDFKGYPDPVVSSITYLDELGAPGTVSGFEIKDGYLIVENAPTVSAVTILFEAGLGAGNIPTKLVQAALQLAEAFYDKSGDGIPAGVKAMVAHHRSFAF